MIELRWVYHDARKDGPLPAGAIHFTESLYQKLQYRDCVVHDSQWMDVPNAGFVVSNPCHSET